MVVNNQTVYIFYKVCFQNSTQIAQILLDLYPKDLNRIFAPLLSFAPTAKNQNALSQPALINLTASIACTGLNPTPEDK